MQSRPFPEMNTDRLKLDQLLHTDTEALYGIFSDPKVIAHYDVERFTEVEQASRLVDYFDARFADDSGIRWAIRDPKTKQLLGTCGYTNWNPYDHSAVLGYELAADQWGKGYAYEAVRAIVEYIFSEQFHFYVHRVEALVLPQNKPSQKLLGKLGFIKEGTLRGKCYWNGAFHDMDMFSFLRDEMEVSEI